MLPRKEANFSTLFARVGMIIFCQRDIADQLPVEKTVEKWSKVKDVGDLRFLSIITGGVLIKTILCQNVHVVSLGWVLFTLCSNICTLSIFHTLRFSIQAFEKALKL